MLHLDSTLHKKLITCRCAPNDYSLVSLKWGDMMVQLAAPLPFSKNVARTFWLYSSSVVVVAVVLGINNPCGPERMKQIKMMVSWMDG